MLVIYGRMLASASRSCLTANPTPNGIRVAIANFIFCNKIRTRNGTRMPM